MAITIDKPHTALFAMGFENDIINENGAFKDIGFAQMEKQSDVLVKTGRVLDVVRRADVKIIFVAAHFRPGHPEIPLGTSAGLF